MSKKSLLGLKPLPMNERNKTEAHASLKNIQDHEASSELCSLGLMYELLKSYRKDFLKTRKEFKKLRDLHSTNRLANLHVEHKLKSLDEQVRSGLVNYNALRQDYIMQRSCFIKKETVSQSR